MSSELAELMRRATQEIPVDTPRLIDAGVARGVARTRARRRRLALGVGTALTIAALAGWAALPSGDNVVVDKPRPQTPVAGPAAPTELSMPQAAELIERLGELLPGSARNVTVPKVPFGLDLTMQLKRTGSAQGLVMVALAVGEPIPEGERQDRLKPCLELQGQSNPPSGTDCVVVDDGWVELVRDDVPPGDMSGLAKNALMAQARYYGYDGRAVMITAWNAPSPSTDVTPGSTPVVSTQELFEIAQDPGWFEAS